MQMKEETAVLTKGLKTLGIEPDALIITKFLKYLDILNEYKNKIHLISHGDYDRISLRHFLPSLAALPYIGEPRHACDIGAGAGFPSIPIKIMRPEINFTLFESTKKKARFLENLVKKLDLAGVEVIADRAEKYSEKKFDLVLAKAAGKIAVLLDIVVRLLKPGGRAIFYKSTNIETEVAAARKRMETLGLSTMVKKIFTPVENSPMALVLLDKG